jgi:hypothetical protein
MVNKAILNIFCRELLLYTPQKNEIIALNEALMLKSIPDKVAVFYYVLGKKVIF